MEVKHLCLVTLVILVIGLVSAQKKKSTTITGDLTKDKATGTRVDLGISHKRGKWGVDGGVFGTSRGHRGGQLGITHKRKNFEFGGSVFGDNRGNRGGKVGFKWRFRRSTKLNEEHFEVFVAVNPCNFDVYNNDDTDNVITMEEMLNVFVGTPQDAKRLFDVLDTSGNGEITEAEFNNMAPEKILDCRRQPEYVTYNV